MGTKTLKRPASAGGFGATIVTPEQYAAGILKNRDDWCEFVDHNRDGWREDYLNRKIPDTVLSDVLDPKGLDPVITGGTMSSKRAEQQDGYFCAHHGLWTLVVSQYKRGWTQKNDYPGQKFDFSFTVSTGGLHTPYPFRARQIIVHNHGEDVYREWKRLVMDGWKESSKWLVDQLRAHHPGFKAWSVACSESSERLMKTCPGVCVRSGIAFMSL